MPHIFDNITLLITHYNRSSSLERLLSAFRSLQCAFGDIVVSDDCSKPEHLNKVKDLQSEYNFRLITTEVNRGLANNINKGQDAVNTPYTLYVQEDFMPESIFPEHFKDAVEIMQSEDDIDIISFYSYIRYPYLKPYKNGYSEMLNKPWGLNYYKIYQYTDHPHLRRSDFLSKFGRYIENIPSDRAEYRMCLSFIQRKGKGLVYNNYKSLFSQYNPDYEPSTVKRNKLTYSQNLLIRPIRFLYRVIRYNYDLIFTKANGNT